MTTNKTAQLLSQKDKINNLSNEAIKDIYTRQHLFKTLNNRTLKRFNQPITEKDKEFKQISLEHPENTLYKAFQKHLDVTVFKELNEKDKSLEEAYFEYVTNDKFTEKEKLEIAREKLITISECCGTPHPQIVHEAVNSYAELEEI